MPARIHQFQSNADARSERHARSFLASQRPPIDARIGPLLRQGYNAHQISSLLRLPMYDVRLMVAQLSIVPTGSTKRARAK